MKAILVVVVFLVVVAPLLAAALAGLWLSWGVVGGGVQPDVRQLPEPREQRTAGGACCCWLLFFEMPLRDFKKQTDGRTQKKVETRDALPLMDERGRDGAECIKAANN